MSTIFAHICTVKKRFSYKLFERVQNTNIAKYLCSVKNRFSKLVFPVAYDRVCTKPEPGKTGSLHFLQKNIRLKHICCLDCFIFEQRKHRKELGDILKLTKAIFHLRRKIFAMHFVQ